MPDSVNNNLNEYFKSINNNKKGIVFICDLNNSMKCKEGMPFVWVPRHHIFFEENLKEVKKLLIPKKTPIIKFIGDALFLFIEIEKEETKTILKFIKSAINLQNRFVSLNEKYSFDQELHKISPKISIDYGDVYYFTYDTKKIKNNNKDVIGKCIDQCSRINNICKPGEIGISEKAYNLIKIKCKYSFKKEERIYVKTPKKEEKISGLFLTQPYTKTNNESNKNNTIIINLDKEKTNKVIEYNHKKIIFRRISLKNNNDIDLKTILNMKVYRNVIFQFNDTSKKFNIKDNNKTETFEDKEKHIITFGLNKSTVIKIIKSKVNKYFNEEEIYSDEKRKIITKMPFIYLNISDIKEELILCWKN